MSVGTLTTVKDKAISSSTFGRELSGILLKRHDEHKRFSVN
ncbi:hypothetical protein T06_9377 [Trichinella sp. T6]|nr:hypothetical protein T06_9377 [Trichinella sp. T6]